MTPWSCGRCTYWHEGADAQRTTCAMCGAHRTDERSPTAAARGPPVDTVAPRGPLPEPPAKCAWLAAEGLRLEARAAELERGGCSAKEASFHHRRAAGKIDEAAALCPEGHPDGPVLTRYAQEIKAREVYLDSLGEASVSTALSLEDFVGEVVLVMDLSVEPKETEVCVLLARGGTSGESAELSEAGFRLVVALRSSAELLSFARRIIDADGRRLREGVEEKKLETAVAPAKSFAELQSTLRASPLVELNIDPSKDKLEVAVQFENEAKLLEDQGRRADAAQMYSQAIALLQYVHKYDPRTKNEKVKDMIGKRLAEITSRAERVAAAEGGG